MVVNRAAEWQNQPTGLDLMDGIRRNSHIRIVLIDRPESNIPESLAELRFRSVQALPAVAPPGAP